MVRPVHRLPGRCLLSGYFNHRDANQGPAPTRAAGTLRLRARISTRWPRSRSEIKRHRRPTRVYYLEERERPGEFMPIFEDEHGTYIMNSRDLRAVEHVHRLAGDRCRLPEDRGSHQVALLHRTHHPGIPAGDRRCGGGRAFNAALLAELEHLANRATPMVSSSATRARRCRATARPRRTARGSQFVAEVKGVDPASGCRACR